LRVLVYEGYGGAIHGNQRYIILLAQYLPQTDMELRLATGGSGALSDMASCLMQTYTVDTAATRFPLYFVKHLANIIKSYRPDVIVCNNERSLLVAWFASFWLGAKYVWYIKNAFVFFPTDIIGALISDRILTISASLPARKGKLFQWLTRKKTKLMPIGIPLDQFTKVDKVATEEMPLRLLVMAAITPMKGFDEFMEALELLDLHSSHLLVRIIGAVPPGQEDFDRSLRDRAARLNNVKVEFCGWTNEVVEELTWSHVVILPSRSEGVPRSLIEAMAAGRPVIATDVGGVRETVPPDVGIVVPAESPKALADAIRLLERDRVRMAIMGDRGREWVTSRYDIRAHVEMLRKELHELRVAN